MYAVIDNGGKQYRVMLGDRLKVESIKAEPGAKISLDRVLMVVDEADVKVGAPHLDTAVEATVIGHGRGKKVRIFKMRRRKNSRQHAGHRQNYTELEITRIGVVAAKPKPVKATTDKSKAASSKHDASPKATKAGKSAEAATADDLTQINGIGPVIVEKLNGIGITTFTQLAALTEEDIERINEQLNLKGRIERDNWIGQAKRLI